MPVVDATFLALIQPLDEGQWLGEVLFYPEISRAAGSRQAVQDALRRNAVALAETLPLTELTRRRSPREVAVASRIAVSVAPPPGSIAWREPLELHLDVVCWTAADGTAIAYVPALQMEVAGSDPEEVYAAVPEQALTRLLRPRDAFALERLVAIDRRGPLELVRLSAALDVPTPLERARKSGEAPEASALEEAATDLTKQPQPPAWGLDDALLRLAELVSGGASVLLVGPSGVGKTTLCHELVRRRGDLGLERTPFWETSGARLVAGMSGFGMWQQRCERVWREAAQKKAVLVLGNLVELMEVGRSGADATGIAEFFRPYVMRGGATAILECTPEQLTLVDRSAPRLLEPFERLVLEEPTPEQGARILREAAAGRLSESELATLDRLHRRYATASVYPGRPLRFLHALLEEATRRTVTDAFAQETGLPLFLLDDEVRLDLAETRAFFTDRVLGQAEAVELVVDLLATSKAGLARPGRPLASLLLIGPTGVGKTEMARSLAELLFRDRAAMARFDMSEYADPLSVRRLIGGGAFTAPVGAGEPWRGDGLLTGRVREQPFSVLLLDELEKADASFFDLLLQVLGDARLTDAAGRLADFRNCVVVMTSNLGAASFRSASPGLVPDRDADAARHFVEEVRAWLRPELFNRIDRIVPFRPLDAETLQAVARKELTGLQARDGIAWRRVSLAVDDGVADLLAREAYDPRYGARPLKRAVERRVLGPLAEALNAYAADVPLQATMSVEGTAIKTRVRAATTASHDDAGALSLARDCAVLRRRAVALVRGPAAMEAQNEAYRLEQRGDPPPRVGVLKKVLDLVAEVEVKAAALEDDLLGRLYAREALDLAAFRPRLSAVEDEWSAALLALYALRFAQPDRVTVALFSDQPPFLRALAEAYHEVMRQFGLAVEATAFHAGSAAAVPVPKWHSDADHLSAFPPGTLGVALHGQGATAWPRFSSEAGLHLLQSGPEQASRCLVHVAEAAPHEYVPPADVHRKSGLLGHERRRTYLVVDRAVDDAVLKRRLSWTSRDLAEALALAVAACLTRAAEEAVLP